MAKLSLFGALTNVQMLVHTLLHGKNAGQDSFGNKYYTGKARRGTQRQRRWVIYSGVTEATNVPPEWHGWLHHQTDVLPTAANNAYRQSWQKPHEPNMTGTAGAYLPPGHTLNGNHRPGATGDYVAWQPPK